jgi:hypothetical protein
MESDAPRRDYTMALVDRRFSVTPERLAIDIGGPHRLDVLLVPLANIRLFGVMVNFRLSAGPSPRPIAGHTEPLFFWRGSFFADTLVTGAAVTNPSANKCRVFETGPAANADRSISALKRSDQDSGESRSLSAMRARSGKEEAFIFRMTWPR